MTPATWDYVHADFIADQYDAYFLDHQLFALDAKFFERHFTSPGLVLDLGCGTGRSLAPLAERGFRGIAVDLSLPMLRVARRKASGNRAPITCVQSNMVELDWLGDATVDYAICLFSTLGMIHGADNRQHVLDHVHRVLKPHGVFVLHVHNFWFNLFDPGGPSWLASNLLRSLVDRRVDRGDKTYPYRGLSSMFLHVFTRREVVGALTRSGLRITEILPIDGVRGIPLPAPWLMGSIRASGWLVACRSDND